MATPTPRIVRTLRLTRLLLHVVRGATTIAVVFPVVDRGRQRQLIRNWSQGLLSILRVRLRTNGIAQFSPRTVILANHVSWIDIWLLNSVNAVCFVAKSEIRSWPIIGWMAAQAKTLFIERDRKRDTSRINGSIHLALEEQEAVVVFPEGSTSDGTEVRRFHASLLQPAIDAQARVLALAIRYLNTDGSTNTDVAYVDETTLWQSVKKILAQREVHAEVTELGEVQGKSRRHMAYEAELRVRALVAIGNPPEKPSGLPTELP